MFTQAEYDLMIADDECIGSGCYGEVYRFGTMAIKVGHLVVDDGDQPEQETLKEANRVGVGPKLICPGHMLDKHFGMFAMQYVMGRHPSKLGHTADELYAIALELIEQQIKLLSVDLFHVDLHNENVIVKGDKVTIIDMGGIVKCETDIPLSAVYGFLGDLEDCYYFRYKSAVKIDHFEYVPIPLVIEFLRDIKNRATIGNPVKELVTA